VEPPKKRALTTSSSKTRRPQLAWRCGGSATGVQRRHVFRATRRPRRHQRSARGWRNEDVVPCSPASVVGRPVSEARFARGGGQRRFFDLRQTSSHRAPNLWTGAISWKPECMAHDPRRRRHSHRRTEGEPRTMSDTKKYQLGEERIPKGCTTSCARPAGAAAGASAFRAPGSRSVPDDLAPVSDGGHHAGSPRALDRDSRAGARHLQAVAPGALIRAERLEKALDTGQDLLQV